MTSKHAQGIEAAAKAFYEGATGLTNWQKLVDAENALAERYREHIGFAVSAYLSTVLDETELAEIIPAPRASERVQDWPEDEREFYRNGDRHGYWASFTERGEGLDQLRRRKVARAIIAHLRGGYSNRLEDVMQRSFEKRAGGGRVG